MDDIGEQRNKALKNVCFELLNQGDFVEYSNVKKGILMEFSHHCVGLQLSDYCVGVFTANLKRIKTKKENNYPFAKDILFSHLYKKIRNKVVSPPYCEVYSYGIDEVPNNCGKEICKNISNMIDEKLTLDLYKEMADWQY